MSDTTFSIRIPDDLRREVDALAKANKRSRSFLVKEALQAYVDEQKAYRDAIKEAIREADETGEFISWGATQHWLKSWGTDNELPPPEPDIFLKKQK
ncbi:MAG: CopG family ribbon-helix-helix protein [Mesorhizobium sp.]|nr:CopG family ribbon-helix-helix protein [Mesorhizobium sp.]MBN9242924.1 CopG family ribbon-helix-helix protein [Mesorhizobium sp.]